MSSPRTRPRRVRPDAPVDVSLGFVPTAAAVVSLAVPLMVVFIIVAAVVPFIPWWLGVLVGLGVAGFAVWQRLRNAHDHVVNRLVDHRGTVGSVRLTNMVKGLALAAGVAKPEAVVIDDAAANALVVARNESATLVLTKGLLDLLEPVELEGVVAELLVRLRNGDAEAATIGAALYRLPLLGPLSAALAPTAGLGLSHLLTDERDLDADLEAVALTRYPPGLHNALSKARDGILRPDGIGGELDLLWLIHPDQEAGGSARSALDLRIDVLNEL